MADLLNDPELRNRKKSIRTIEINGPKGNRVVAMDELNEADAVLAAKFGYTPVFKRVNMLRSKRKGKEINMKLGIWLSFRLFFCCQHQWIVLNSFNYFRLSIVCRRECQCRLVLGHLRSRLYVYCSE
jgi:hypothetical protein